jgi:superfamily II DNA or RNA helicase
VGDILHHWNIYAKGRTTVAFASSLSHAKHIRDVFVAGGVTAEYLDGETPDDQRDAILRRLEDGETTVAVNMGILTEGWDCPKVSCVILARPTKSLGLYLQMAGRALRPFPGKADCVILDHGGNSHAHGLVTDPRFFCLDPAKKILTNKISLKTCPKCFAVFKGKDCPSCGYTNAEMQKEDNVEHKPGNLVEFVKTVTQIEDDFFNRMRMVQFRQGKSDKWTAVQFKLKFGKWPPMRLTGNIWRKKAI